MTAMRESVKPAGTVGRICSFISDYMALIVLLAAAAAFFFPSTLCCIRTSWISWMLGLVMFGMGLTLNPSSFRTVFSRPGDVLFGCACQFVVMPVLAFVLARLFRLPDELAIGVILVGCCPGGTSSNVITYLSKGDVALSVAMTAVSTLLAPLLTPLITWLLAGAYVHVNVLSMFLSILEVILIPIALGLLVRRFLPDFTNAVSGCLPAFSTVVITLIVIAVVAANAAGLRSCGLLVIAVVVLHNLCGYGLGFVLARLKRMPASKCTAVSIEVGMQNSGLACSLAQQHFNAMALATVPGAVFSVWHNISGALISRIFKKYNI